MNLFGTIVELLRTLACTENDPFVLLYFPLEYKMSDLVVFGQCILTLIAFSDDGWR